MTKDTRQTCLPTIRQPLLRGFRAFNRWYLRKHFHTVAVNRQNMQPAPFDADDALVVYANHASWWDPLAAIFLAEELFGDFRMYAPIEQAAFEKYRMFGQLGFFPVAQANLQGAKSFLNISRSLLTSPGASLWLTPEGRFVDVRDTQAPLMPGLAHLAFSLAKAPAASSAEANQPRVWFVPAALEYTFWEERLPELLVWLGEPLQVSTEALDSIRLANSKQMLDEELHGRLRHAQSQLAVAAQHRNSEVFEVFLRSSGQTFFVYDWMRRFQSLWTGKPYEPNHSDKLSS